MQNALVLNTYREPARTQTVYAFVKRSFDIICSLLLIVLLMPVLLVVAVISAVDTKSNPLFIQTRMGRNNRPFRMIEFRTMSPKAPSNMATHRFTDALDYISPVGGALRKLSLDELPQLFNILIGDMSFVGPRPVVLTETGPCSVCGTAMVLCASVRDSPDGLRSMAGIWFPSPTRRFWTVTTWTICRFPWTGRFFSERWAMCSAPAISAREPQSGQ